jgi:spore photoproduct lyase
MFEPTRIVLARGSERGEYANRIAAICALYPSAEVVSATKEAHNRIDLGTHDLTEAHYRGKQTLVLAVHNSAVRLSDEEANTCPNYWHFSPYGFCPFDCSYCYLAGTPGVRFSPTVKIYLNLDQIIDGIDKAARRLAVPTAFYCGKLQDGLALDPLTGYSRALVPFFANHPHARMALLTKSTEVDNLLGLDHQGHTILSWSVNPPEVVAAFEPKTPGIDDRLAAMRKCAAAGYPVRAVLMPVVPVDGWEAIYARFVERLLTTVPLSRLTIGGICSYSCAKALMEHKLGEDNAISRDMAATRNAGADGRTRYPQAVREWMYRHLIDVMRRYAPGIELSLCLEEPQVFAALGLEDAMGRCNCVL